METLRTPYQNKRDEIALKVWSEYEELAQNPENSRMMIAERLAKKYGYTCPATIWHLRKRAQRIMEGRKS